MRPSIGKKKNYIYLAGNISEDTRTYEWREEFTEIMWDEPDVVIVNPCGNRFNQGIRDLGKEGKDGLEFTKEAVKRSQKLLRAKDYQMIKMCNVMVAHLGLSNPKKPMIGTVQELTWATDVFYIPVIALTEGEENIYTTHSWIDECVSAWTVSVEDAANLVKEFFLEY
jgi:hypothetical protein